MRFIVTIDGVRREVEVEAGDAAAGAVLAAVVGAAGEAGEKEKVAIDDRAGDAAGSPSSGPKGVDVPIAPVTESREGFDIRGGVRDAGITPASGASVGFGGRVSATMNGTVIKVAVKEGDRVAAGDLLLLIEALKVESRVQAPTDGVVREMQVELGAMVSAGQMLLRVIEP